MLETNLKEIEKVLYVVDTIRGFVCEGPLHDERIAKIIPEEIRLIEKFKKENQGVAFVRDAHNIGSSEFRDFPQHCLIGTSESELVDELKSYEEDALIYLKNSTSVIFAKNFLTDLEKMGNLKEVVGVGCCTDICVLNLLIPLKNYFNEIDKDVHIFAVKNAIETYNKFWTHRARYYNKTAYKLMAQAGVIVVENMEELEKKEEELGLTLKRGI